VTRPRYSRRYGRFFFSLFAAFALFIIILSAVLIVDRHANWEQTQAKIIAVERSKATVYSVTFAKKDGETCNELIYTTDSPELPVGSFIEIIHDESCGSALEADDRSWIAAPLGGGLFLFIGLIGAYLYWFRADASGKISWPLTWRKWAGIEP
jgi:hypothetical protein